MPEDAVKLFLGIGKLAPDVRAVTPSHLSLHIQ